VSGLNWDVPPISNLELTEADAPTLRIRVVGAGWFAAAFKENAHAREDWWDTASAAYTWAIAFGADEPEV
jgi:hypothetical protein